MSLMETILSIFLMPQSTQHVPHERLEQHVLDARNQLRRAEVLVRRRVAEVVHEVLRHLAERVALP